MTLTSRLSYFFLTMLAVVLIGFSFSLYEVVNIYLVRQSEEQLTSISNSLSSAIEIADDNVEWESSNRVFHFDATTLGTHFVWIIGDENGSTIDHSKNAMTDDILRTHSLPKLKDNQRQINWSSDGWRFSQKWVQPTNTASSSDVTPLDQNRFRALSVTAGISTAVISATKNRLIIILAVISTTIWLIALVASRYVCRRALLPVTQMAENAKMIDANDLSQRLDQLNSRDELENLNHSFNGLLDRVQESFERQRKFTSDASHQLRTPLAGIRGQIEVALRRERSDEEYKSILEKVLKRSVDLTQIVESLLFLARAESDAVQPQVMIIDLNEWLPQYLARWSEHIRFTDVIFTKKSNNCKKIAVPETLLRELINVLLDNAFKYSSPGSQIIVSLDCDNDSNSVHITDHGIGIAPSDLSKLFIPFFRTDHSERLGIDGVGLGLSIAERIASSIGAKLSATSQIDHGSTFSISFNTIV